MSFGWSAGDIAAALTLAYNLIEALDSVDGAAGNYREAVTFLRDLKRTLEPLAKFPGLAEYPSYGEEISQQVSYIKEPVETFLQSVGKYESSLGPKASKGHHRHIVPKLKWHTLVSRKAISLRQEIQSHMRIIDTLIQRLTLDVVLATEKKLPHTLRTTLQETLRPELISILREYTTSYDTNLVASFQVVQTTNHATISSNLEGHYAALSNDISALKREMEHSTFTQRRIEACLKGGATTWKQQKLLDDERRQGLTGRRSVSLDQNNAQIITTGIEGRGSHQGVFYLVLLYLGHFLKNLFIVLSRMVEPSRALMPVLLAKYNLSFLDAIGSPPRVLPIEFFRSFKVLQEFIQHEFRTNGLPGSAWVDRGRYQIISLANNRSLNEQSWSGSIGPGTTVAMSMVVRTVLESSEGSFNRCPELNCSGKWPKPKSLSWVTCPECQKEVLTSAFSNADVEDELRESQLILPSAKKVLVDRDIFPRGARSNSVTTWTPDEDDISLFKRIVQEVSAMLRSQPQPGTSSNTLEVAGLILGAFPLLISAAEHYKEGFEPLRKWKRFRTDFVGFIDSVDIEKQLFDQMMKHFLISADVPHEELQLFMVMPSYGGWLRQELAEVLQRRMGASYRAFSHSIGVMYALMVDLMSLLSLKGGKVDWASETASRWDYQLKKIRLSFNKDGARLLTSLEFYNRRLRELLDPK